MHLSLLAERLDDIVQSADPINHLSGLDDHLSDVLRSIDESVLLTMLATFQNDIHDLACLIAGETIGESVRTAFPTSQISRG
ncbi:MAG: hypothetical protein H0T91_06550 [Propionibacteriaceae bacterium]|nr:hypothetical protein [Propionibacteriaceae bacterium]